MKVNTLTLESAGFPEALKTIPTAPKKLYAAGASLTELLARPCVTIVGSRKVSSYGRAVTVKLASDLARAGVVIVSGLAIGVDALAHQAALEAGGLTIAVLPGGLDSIYPASHNQLAARILGQGGALLTEYPPGTRTYPINFIARNRIASGLSSAVLITEAAEKSGTLHTARFALEQGKDVLAVPGNITSPTSVGTNNLIKAGAMPVTETADIFHILGIKVPALTSRNTPKGDTPHEQTILNLLVAGVDDGGELLRQSNLEVAQFNQTLTMLEITGKIRSLGANKWSLH
ncbi:MAG: DNA-processing protein DprA [Patescibacteria group bacterium]